MTAVAEVLAGRCWWCHDQEGLSVACPACKDRRRLLRAVATQVPTNWLDPILTGPEAVGIPKGAEPAIAEILRRVKARILGHLEGMP